MLNNRVDIAMRELIASCSCLEAEDLIERLASTAAAVTGTAYAGFVCVDALRQDAAPVHVHAPPGDPLRLRRWLTESGVLRQLPASVRLARDVTVGEPGFLATTVPIATRDHTL